MKVKHIFFTLFLLVLSLYSYQKFLKMEIRTNYEFGGHSDLNEHKIQSVLYNANRSKLTAILVGTSLTEFLSFNPFLYYNFGLVGMNSIDGLRILNGIPFRTENVFIETNFFYRRPNQQYTDRKLSFWSKVVQRDFLFLRAGNEPIQRLLQSYIPKKQKPETKTFTQKESEFRDKNRAKRWLEIEQEFQSPESKKITEGALITFREEVLKLKVRGKRIFFYEVPWDCKLVKFPISEFVHREILNFAKKENIPFYFLKNCQDFETYDFLHLTPESAQKYIESWDVFANQVLQ